uniref:Uncharacterized protein n=1 Tax=Arundo donax TaxID=35708 RepID=A0A0A9D0C0_ARUDO
MESSPWFPLWNASQKNGFIPHVCSLILILFTPVSSELSYSLISFSGYIILHEPSDL